jgi:hypothetical protein
LKKERDYFTNSQTLISQIIADEVFTLKELSSHPAFTTETRILPKTFSPSPNLQHRPTLIHIAALFGSIKCFKFLISLGVHLEVTDDKCLTLTQFAVSGVNIEIIRLCEQFNLKFFESGITTIKYHRNEIFEWLAETKFPDLN